MNDANGHSTHKEDWPNTPKGYQLLAPIGKGYVGIVYRGKVLEGRYQGKEVAIKKIDLENCANTKIEEFRKNILLLNLLDHPNILSYKTSFTSSKYLWVITELMEGGSVEKIMQLHFPDGLKDQALIATIMKETLMGLKYLHQNSQIHRDIKASNILIGADGSVKISDFGVAAGIKEGKKRCTFIGSPCWMAPEVLEQNQESGYDSKVDLWSLGITALELAHGKPPNSELTTMKLILKTLNDDPPELKEEGHWDDSFREFIKYCLVKNPAQRKSAEDLLKHCKSFFAKVKSKDYVKDKLVKGLGTLESRFDQKVLDQEEGKEKKKIKCNLEFCFTVDDQEEQPLDLHFPSHSDKVSTIGIGLNENFQLKRKLSAGEGQGENGHTKNYKFSQKQKSERILICKGDVTNDFNLPDEES